MRGGWGGDGPGEPVAVGRGGVEGGVVGTWERGRRRDELPEKLLL